MDHDLGPLLRRWPYDAENAVRMVRGLDGRRKIQVRLPLGMEQYELDGRPDGARPRGRDSLLEHWERRLDQYRRRHGSEHGFGIPPSACESLRDEAMLYYYRYVLLFQIGEYGRSARDTARNLRCIDLIESYGQTEDDRRSMAQYRPYIVRMHRASRALLAVKHKHYEIALRELKRGARRIRGLDEPAGMAAFAYEKRRSLAFLKQLAREVRRRRPVSAKERLRRLLKRAVQREDYEEAARLRDRLASLRSDGGRHQV
jgi:hypothetical protein